MFTLKAENVANKAKRLCFDSLHGKLVSQAQTITFDCNYK